MKLELKHLAGYLPYELKVSQPRLGKIESYLLYGFKYSEYAKEWTVFIDDSRHGNYQNVYLKGVKPILRPLSDLTKEIEVNGEKFVPLKKLNDSCFGLTKYYIFIRDNNSIALLANYREGFNCLSSDAKEQLLEWHFDIFGLIPEGLAIDINTL